MDSVTTEKTMDERTPTRSSSSTPDATSQSSNQAANNDSPLMKLVDAALGPSSPGHDDDASIPERVEIKADGTNPLDVKADSSSEEVSPPVAEEDKVIRGTIHDLVSRQEKKATFAEFLMQCLNDEANHDVIRWMPCGTQFTITNHRKFTMERMPQLFKIRNMSSFVRKLTRWGFSRVHEKATGNSDIFKHPYFQRDKPDLCKKIRCVSRSTMEETKSPSFSMEMRAGPPMLMGDFPGSSLRSRGFDLDQDLGLPLSSPRRSIGHSLPHYHGRTPPAGASRFHPSSTPRASSSYLPPRISPEAEREMMERSAFHAQLSPPQVYTSPTISRTMSAAAEYELEQVLLERQRARMMRNEQQHQHLRASQQQQYPQGRHMDMPLPSSRISAHERSRVAMQPPRIPLESGSERSLNSFADRRYSDNGHDFYDLPTDANAVTAALEKMSQDGEYDLDMSPREAMIRAVLHKRSQQKVLQSQSIPFSEATVTSRGTNPARHPAYFR